MTVSYTRGDGKVLEARAPAKLTAAWKNGFDAGLAAMAAAVHAAGVRVYVLPVTGVSVHVLADHHIDEAISAARVMVLREMEST